ncbi:hypothetical protein GEW_13041 [Pasteurella multocida subsp. gallicida str. Anand1_poultry]|nr:hypothetical protein GEW_13041 [Pasteurella multocida subsp. gallicida str. Anand1_poultry]
MTETVTITKAEYESLLADKKRLDFIEKNWCEVIDGIPEIKITTHIIVGETQLRPALDQVINGYEKLNFHWEYSNWISVDDKLPEVETPVIAFCEGEYGEHYAIASREIADGEYFWVAINQNGPIYDLAINVTHWQPIPRLLIKE